MNRLKAWIISVRLQSLTLSLSAIIMGSICAARNGLFRWEVFIWASLTAIFLQILTNLSNDYGDSVSGADDENRQGPKRMIQSGFITIPQMKTAFIISGICAFCCGLVMIYAAFGLKLETFLFLILGIIAVFAAVRYTVGRNPYGYRGFGDISVFLFFGIAGVAGTYFLHGITWNWTILLPASTLGFFVTGVLNINNIRDIEPDKKVGKNTLIVKIGRQTASWYHFFLILSGWICFLVFISISGKNHLFPILTLPLFIMNVYMVFNKNSPKELDLQLRNLSLMTLLFVILYAV